MKQLQYLVFLYLLIPFGHTGMAQQPDRCGTMPYLEQLKKRNPLIVEQLQKNENALNALQSINKPALTTTIRIVPVVVHLIWHEPEENLCDAIIESQIEVLNEDYSRLNSDTVNTPEVFKASAGVSQIKFVLANRDPNGNVTTGIVRSYSDSVSFLFGNEMKFDSLGGQNAWDADRYMNIWVCNLNGSVLGYATLPGTANAGEDGLVIASKAFGRFSYDPAGKYNLGRTTTHEAGHWLNLYHTWGDDGGGCSGTDYVMDTPNQDNYTFGCPDFPEKSCGNGPDGNMFMNYMDYTDDKCMNLFTTGQVTRMEYALDSLRTSILSSNGYFPDSNASTFNQLVDVLVVPNPFQTSFDIKVRLKKKSDLDIDVFDIMGKLLFETKFNDCCSHIFHVEMQNFNQGLYIARIKTENETVITKLFLTK